MLTCNTKHAIVLYKFNLHFYPFLNTSFVVTVQITHNLNGTHLSHMCDMRGVNHTHVGFLDSTHVYIHTHYLHSCVFLHMFILIWLM